MDGTTTNRPQPGGPTARVTLEAEEWYVLTNWLRERENRLQYALRPKSDEWAFVRDLRRSVESQRGERSESAGVAEGENDADGETGVDAETAGVTETVALTDRQVAYLSSFLHKRARKLRILPWRDRERRDVLHLRDHLRATVEREKSEKDE